MSKNVLSPALRLLSPANGPHAPLRLFAFPYAGAGAYSYRSWAALLPGHIELIGIQLPGREDRSNTPPLDDLPTVLGELSTEIAAACADGADWAVFGHSLGAVLGYAVARSITATHGMPPLKHVLVSGSRALHLIHRNHQPVHDFSDPELIEHIRSFNGTPEEIFADPATMRFLLRLIRADYSLFDQYDPADKGLLSCPITVFAGDADPSTSPATVAPWAQLTSSSCAVHTLPGDHFFVNQSRGLLLHLVSRVLAPEASS